MNDEDRSMFRKLADRLAGGDGSDAAGADLEALVKTHGEDAVKAAVAKSFPADETDDTLTQEDRDMLAALVPAPVVKSTEPKSTDDRLAAIEAALAKLAEGPSTDTVPVTDVTKQATPDAIALVKQGVPLAAVEDAKPLLDHADKSVRDAAVAMLVKQADPRIVALMKGEEGSATIPADDAKVQEMVAQLAKADGDISAGIGDAARLLAILEKAAN